MFVTIRAKLIAFSSLSLLFLVLVGALGFYEKSEMKDAIEYTQGNVVLMNSNARVSIAEDGIRADTLQILREAKSGETVAFKDAVKNLNDQLKAVSSNTIKIMNTTAIAEKTRQAVVAVRADFEGYAKSAQDIVAMAQRDAVGAEALFDEFNERHKKLKLDQSLLDNLIAEEAAGIRQAADDAALLATKRILAAVGAAFIILALCSYLFVRGIMGSLNQMQRAIAKVEAGHYEMRANLTVRDEIGALGRAFDKLVDKHIATLKTTAAENERLNNSVIGLFGAMGALSEKDLTVRAPMTDDIIGALNTTMWIIVRLQVKESFLTLYFFLLSMNA